MSGEKAGDSAIEGPRVRVATAADGDAFVRFNCAMALETENKRLPEEKVVSGVRSVLDDPARGFYVVAECNAEIVGALMVTFEWSDWRDANFWWIQSVYVIPQYRKRGVYRALYQFVRERAQSAGGVCGFRLYVEKDNLGAQQAYESLGMSKCDYLMYEEPLRSE